MPDDDEFDDLKVPDDGQEKKKGVTKGANYWVSKTKHLIYTAKILYVDFVVKHRLKLLKLDESAYQCTLQFIIKEYGLEKSFTVEAMLLPLPEILVRYVHDILDSDPQARLLPETYDEAFFSRLYGIGPKCLSLIAEGCYNKVVGPAIDCHMIRYAICTGCACALNAGNTDKFGEQLMTIFPANLLPCLNETPASIAQLSRMLTSELRQELYNGLLTCGRQEGWGEQVRNYLSFYFK